MDDGIKFIKKSKENRVKNAFERIKEDFVDIKALSVYSGLKIEILLHLIYKYKKYLEIKEIDKKLYVKAKNEKVINTLIEEAKKYIEASDNSNQ